MKSIEITATSVESAVDEACQQLGLTKDQVSYEIVKEGGFIRKKYTVVVTEIPAQPITAEATAENFVRNVINIMGLNCQANLMEDSDTISIQLEGEDTASLIGYRGDVLDSLQYLTLLVANKVNPQGKRVVLDGENYREKRAMTLSKLAKRLAFKASKENEIIKLEPMNPFERRIIHSALQDDTYVTTESEGEEPNRCIVIKPVRKERTPRNNTYDRPRNNSNRSDRGDRSDRPSRPKREYQDTYVPSPAPVPTENEEVNMYNEEFSRNFKKTGIKKMRSFGAPKRKF